MENAFPSRAVARRSFLAGVGVAAAGAALPLGTLTAGAWDQDDGLSNGDAAILRFLAAAELIEHDLWTQYAELGGAGGGNHPYLTALGNIDPDMPQYVSDNTDDELSHAAFLNAYLAARGREPVDLDRFRTLSGSTATGAGSGERLTNLQALRVDTTWYTRYRSTTSPDFGATFAEAVHFPVPQPAIPPGDADTGNPQRIQAIANTAAFHFAAIEQGGASLYAAMCLKASSPEVLRILVGIGGTEVAHFAIWHDKAGNAVSAPLAPLTDPVTGVTFPDLNDPPGDELRQTNLIMPEPCTFIDARLPECSVIRPADAGAVAAATGLARSGLFAGQSDAFYSLLLGLARQADAARRR